MNYKPDFLTSLNLEKNKIAKVTNIKCLYYTVTN